MPGYSDLLVGFGERDVHRADFNLDMKYAGRCVNCSCRVYVTPSGFDILRRDDCDARLVCRNCDKAYPEEWERVM